MDNTIRVNNHPLQHERGAIGGRKKDNLGGQITSPVKRKCKKASPQSSQKNSSSGSPQKALSQRLHASCPALDVKTSSPAKRTGRRSRISTEDRSAHSQETGPSIQSMPVMEAKSKQLKHQLFRHIPPNAERNLNEESVWKGIDSVLHDNESTGNASAVLPKSFLDAKSDGDNSYVPSRRRKSKGTSKSHSSLNQIREFSESPVRICVNSGHDSNTSMPTLMNSSFSSLLTENTKDTEALCVIHSHHKGKGAMAEFLDTIAEHVPDASKVERPTEFFDVFQWGNSYHSDKKQKDLAKIYDRGYVQEDEFNSSMPSLTSIRTKDLMAQHKTAFMKNASYGDLEYLKEVGVDAASQDSDGFGTAIQSKQESWNELIGKDEVTKEKESQRNGLKTKKKKKVTKKKVVKKKAKKEKTEPDSEAKTSLDVFDDFYPTLVSPKKPDIDFHSSRTNVFNNRGTFKSPKKQKMQQLAISHPRFGKSPLASLKSRIFGIDSPFSSPHKSPKKSMRAGAGHHRGNEAQFFPQDDESVELVTVLLDRT